MNNRGFTLLEIVVSLAILSIALVTLLTAHNRALMMNAEAVAITDATMLAREEMEKLYINPLPDVGKSEKKKRDEYPDYAWRSEISETPFNGVWEARLNIFRANDDKEKPIISLKSYLTK